MKLGMNHPMGPLTLADFIGLDTCLAIMEVLHKELGDSKYRPAVLLRQYVDTGFLGTCRVGWTKFWSSRMRGCLGLLFCRHCFQRLLSSFHAAGKKSGRGFYTYTN